MFKTKLSFFKLIACLYLLNSYSCSAMDQEVPQQFGHLGLDPNENFSWETYQRIIEKGRKQETRLFEDLLNAKNSAQKEEAETKRKHKNERLHASAATYQSTYAAPLLESQADEAQAEFFKAQARLHDKTADSLKYNNYYTVAKDGTVIVTQLVAPSLSPALSPVFLAARQRYLGKTAAEIEEENYGNTLKKAKNAHDLASIKETESRELANIAASLHQGCGAAQRGKGLEECIESARLLAEANLNALKDLTERQKATSSL
jgi:hypothetical protein